MPVIRALDVTTEDGNVTLHVLEEDEFDLHALPLLPDPEPEDCEPECIVVRDVVTGRVFDVCRGGLGCDFYAEDITESWQQFLDGVHQELQEARLLVALSACASEAALVLSPADVAAFTDLPKLAPPGPDDLDNVDRPSVAVTDLVTGQTYRLFRGPGGRAVAARPLGGQVVPTAEEVAGPR